MKFTFLLGMPTSAAERDKDDTIPRVTVESRPTAVPIAMTQSRPEALRRQRRGGQAPARWFNTHSGEVHVIIRTFSAFKRTPVCQVTVTFAAFSPRVSS